MPSLNFLLSLSPFNLLVALCSANFLFSKSLEFGGVLPVNDGLRGAPRPNGDVDFDLNPVPEGLNELLF